jgi:simple sugar transport system permease protein
METYNTKKVIKTDLNDFRKRIPLGVIFIFAGLFIWFVFSRNIDPGMITIFVMNPGGAQVSLPDVKFDTLNALNIIAAVCTLLGIFQIVRGFRKFTTLAIFFIGVLVTIGFLAWGAESTTINVGGMLRVMILRSVPITLGALAAILCERVGVVNIAIEGMMITGALVAAVAGSAFGLWVGMLAAILAGGLAAVLHAILSIKYKINQIISGTIINITTIGLTSYIVTKLLQNKDLQYLNNSGFFQPIQLPILSRIPFFGPILFSHNIYIYIMYLLIILLTVILFYTKWGLRLRAVGEHPKAADTLGVNVFRIRYVSVILGGLLAGFAGSFFVLGSIGYFEQAMTAGRGFISLAAMIFGKWTPIGSFGAGLLFGFAESLATNLSILNFPVKAELLLMLPYIITMVVLAGVVGRSRGPAAAGVPYEKESL